MNKIFLRIVRSIRAREPRMPLTERTLLYSRLALYLRSGIPIRDALGLMCGSAERPASRKILSSVDRAVLHGTSLTRALGAFPQSFPPFETNLIEIGEQSGSLPENLAYLSALLQRRRALTRKIQGALVYPCVIILGTVAITGFLLLYTFPKIVPIFKGLDTPLPFTTRLLIGISDLVTGHETIVFGTILVVTIGITWFVRRPRIKREIERMLLRTPILGSLICAYNLALIARTLSTLLMSGIPLIPALALIGNGIRNQEYRSAVYRVSDQVNGGQHLTEALRRYPFLFPHTFAELVAAGESTGSLSTSLGTAAELYEEDLDEGTRTLATLIEPALMIMMGLLVGFVAMAIISPIYGITQNLSFR